jgi:hypothetical protein
MLEGILRVFDKTRPQLPAGSRERSIVDQQAARFETDLAAARARASLALGEVSAARRDLAALSARRGGWLLRLAARVPALAVFAYQARQRMRGGLFGHGLAERGQL